jgi:crotonobetainyl-CoA:carnitine CoA-transferase CaiB-like acyl-CoA transferase
MAKDGHEAGEAKGLRKGGGALAGVKVVDLTRVLGGPYGTQLLADHGADVIKLEPPQGDEVRDWGPPFHDEDAAYFIGINRNKRSVGLDLGKPEGREVLLRLLEGADVVIENFKPGSMEAWGIGYEELKKKFPRLIYCKISGFGADGPLGGFPGYDGIVGAMTGHYSVNGSQESGPMRLGLPVVDISMGLYCVIGILLSMREREISGEGQQIEVTLYDAAMSLMHPHFPNYHLSGKVPQLTGNQHANLVPYGMYPTKTVPVMIGAGNNRAFKKVCEVLGRPELADDPRFKTNGDRQNNRDALNEIITAKLGEVDGMTFALELLATGLPCGPVLNTKQVLESEHTKARGMIYEMDWYKGTGTPVKLSRTPGGLKSPPPKFSAHAREVLREHGFDEAAIERLAAAGVVVEKRRT